MTAPRTWGEYSEGCLAKQTPPLERRPVNGLNIEIGQPMPRCTLQPPDGRGITRDGSTLAWLHSGGSLLAYGRCTRDTCPKRRESDDLGTWTDHHASRSGQITTG